MNEKIIELTEITPDSYKWVIIIFKFIEWKRKSHTRKTYLKTSKILSFSEMEITNKKHSMYRKDYPNFTLIKLLGGKSICVKESCSHIKKLI